MTLSNLQEQAVDLIDSQNFLAARPYLLELVNRFEGESEEIKKRLEGIYFYLGVGYLVEYSESPSNDKLETAIQWFQRLVNEFPDGFFAVNGSLAMADAHRGLQQWKKAAGVYVKLLSPPLSFKLKNEQRLEALKKISQAYYIAQDWNAGERWFKALLNESRDIEDQSFGAAALMEAFINQGRFKKAIDLFPFLVGDTPARYKLQFNIALLEAGDKLAEQKQYVQAMLMYRMVLTLEEIIEWQEGYLKNLQSQFRILSNVTGTDSDRAIELETEIFNTEAQIKAMKEITPYTPELRIRIARNYLLTGRDWESFWAYQDLIKDYPDHPSIQDFFYAAFSGATNIGLTDEVIRLGEAYTENPKWEDYKNDMLVRMAQFYIEKGRIQDFFDLAKEFMENSAEDNYSSQIIFLMGATYVGQQDFMGMIDTFKDYIKRFPDSPAIDGFHYWVGMGYVYEQNYEAALAYFEKILNEYRWSGYSEDSLYRKGICLFGIQEIDKARDAFEEFIKRYPNTQLRGEAEYFLGDLEGAIPNVEKALAHYSRVEKYTQNIGFVQNAYFRGAELLEANERYEEMAEKLQTFINKYREEGDLTNAIYQLGRAYEMLGRPGDTLREYWRAIERFGDNPRTYGLDLIIEEYPKKYYDNLGVIEANLELLEKLQNDKAFRELIAQERQALFEYLGQHPNISEDVKRPLYDRANRVALVEDTSPLNAPIDKYRKMREQLPAETPEETFRKGYETAKKNEERSLVLRLQMALEEMGIDINPGQVFTEEDFFYGSPATLIWMGDKNSEFDPNLAREAYRQVLTEHAESEFVLQALLALGRVEAQLGNYEEAITYFQESQERFPGRPELLQAVIAMGDTYRQMRDFDKAREQYNQVLTNRDWRGAPHAEAMFKTGMSYLEEGEQEKAQTFFERTYIGFSAFSDWSGAAYLQSGKLLESMNRPQEAINTYEEFLNEPGFAETKHYEAIRNARSAL